MLMGVHPVLWVFGEWGFGDSQSLKPHPDEHPTQPIEASHLANSLPNPSLHRKPHSRLQRLRVSGELKR
jgi:hypothetical protein